MEFARKALGLWVLRDCTVCHALPERAEDDRGDGAADARCSAATMSEALLRLQEITGAARLVRTPGSWGRARGSVRTGWSLSRVTSATIP